MTRKITAEEMERLIYGWTEGEDIPLETYYAKDGDWWVGCDNTTNDCWVEQFKTEEEAIAWCIEGYEEV